MDANWQAIVNSVPWETVARLGMAIVGGALIGYEREARDKPAGLRTHMLVSLGAAAFMISALEISTRFDNSHAAVRLDPIRALAGIIGGVGFLGAGSIIQSVNSVQGITTAASIWVAAAIGTSCGMGLYTLAISSAVFAVLVLWLVRVLQRLLFPGRPVENHTSS